MYKISISKKTLAKVENELEIKFLNVRQGNDDFAPVEIKTNSGFLYGFLLDAQDREMFPN